MTDERPERARIDELLTSVQYLKPLTTEEAAELGKEVLSLREEVDRLNKKRKEAWRAIQAIEVYCRVLHALLGTHELEGNG